MARPDPAAMLRQLHVVHTAEKWLNQRGLKPSFEFDKPPKTWRATFCHCCVEPVEYRRRVAAAKKAILGVLNGADLVVAEYDTVSMQLNDSTNDARLMMLSLAMRNNADKLAAAAARLNRHPHLLDDFYKMMAIKPGLDYDKYASVLLETVDCTGLMKAIGLRSRFTSEFRVLGWYMYERSVALSYLQRHWKL